MSTPSMKPPAPEQRAIERQVNLMLGQLRTKPDTGLAMIMQTLPRPLRSRSDDKLRLAHPRCLHGCRLHEAPSLQLETSQRLAECLSV